MKKISMKKVIILLVSFTSISLLAREKAPGEQSSSNKINQRVLANCAAPKASKEFWVNNVRTIIFTGGDMWWDRDGNTNAYYYIPAVQNRNNGISSSFSIYFVIVLALDLIPMPDPSIQIYST
jgi:hypothetical protein